VDDLLEAIHAIASSVPGAQVEQLAGCCDGLAGPDAAGRAKASSLVPNHAFKTAIANLWAAWGRDPTVTGPAVALGLRTATLTTERMRAASSLEVVWTGPTSHEVAVRLSSQVLEELVRSARKRLIVVSFAAYKVAAIDEALRDAARRGVKIDLVLETKEDSQGRLKQDAADAFTSLRGVASFWVWPAKKRPPGDPVLHAKAAIADTRSALVTSANFTGHALNSNMELGLLVTGGRVPARLSAHFSALMASGTLAPITPS